MKINLTLTLLFVLICTNSAFGSKARLDALGQNSLTGSNYITDDRSIFSNPAEINNFKNFIITEWGTPNDAADSKASPHAEGGFLKEEGSFIYGVYLGNENGARNSARANTGVTGNVDFLMHDNPIDFFFGGDAGILWAIRAHYASSSDEAGSVTKSNKAYGVGFGANLNNIKYYANLDINDVSEGATAQQDKWESDLGATVGVNYLIQGINLFLEYSKSGYTYTTTGYKVKEAGNIYLAGMGKIYDISQTSKLFLDIRYRRGDEKFTEGIETKAKTITAPLTIAFESKTYDWLILRGSITQNIYSDQSKQTVKNSAVVTGGATFVFKQVEIDGLIGTTASNDGRDPSDSNGEGILATDNLMTRVALRYNF